MFSAGKEAKRNSKHFKGLQSSIKEVDAAITKSLAR